MRWRGLARCRPIGSVMRYASTLQTWRLTERNVVHFHDLRHSSASEMINAGVSLFTVGRVLGHRSAQSTARYSHLTHDTLADAVGKIGRRA